MNCTHCGSNNTEHRGPQKGIDITTRRWYSFPLCQCNHCGTSFGVTSEKRYLDGLRELVPPKSTEGGQG